jgi:hypothetical protein
MKKIIAITLLLALSVVSTFGWGRIGHETIAKVAERHLTKKAKARIEYYLDGHSIMYFAKWMDEYRKTPKYAFTNGWHTDPVDSNLFYAEDKVKPEIGSAIFAIEYAQNNLRDYKHKSDSAVAFNIKVLLHFVGDMHCPAHIKYAGRKMDFPVMIEDWYHNYQQMSFHLVWDNGIFQFNRSWSETEWAEELDKASKSEIEAVTNGSPRDWLHDAAVRSESQFDWAVPGKKLDQDFINYALPLQESLLRDAGYRLAKVLNDIFAK